AGARSPDPRPGVRDGREPRRGQQGCRRRDRDATGREARALRRRPGRAARGARARETRDRLHKGRDVAEDVVPAPAAELQPAAARPAGRAERAHDSAYYFRFTLAYTLLSMVAVAGVAALVIVLTRPDVVRAPSW